MKRYIVEKKMTNTTDGYFNVVVEGETHLNRTVISSTIQFFTTQGGYNYNHPWQEAERIAHAIANGLNESERLRHNLEDPKAKQVEIDFNGHVKTKLHISNNEVTVLAAMNGHGDTINTNNCTITK